MSEHSRIDSHKMMFHPEWVADWKRAKNNWDAAKKLYPLYVEISPVGGCNHRCTFCALDFVGYKPGFLKLNALAETLKDMSFGGVKSIMYAGEGEPCLHPHLAEIIVTTKSFVIDVGLTTNGVLMNSKLLEKSLSRISWIKVSIDAGEKETYLKIHRPKNPNDWEKVFENLKIAVELKRENRYECRIGAQMLLLPESADGKGEFIPGNFDEVTILAKKLKEIGVDYFVVKPYSHQPLSKTESYRDFDYNEYPALWFQVDKLRKIATEKFEIIFRSGAMERYSQERDYDFCGAVPFSWAYIMADGSVYSCSIYLLDKRFYLGNINEQSFQKIWEGDARKKQWEEMKKFNPKDCRKNCRMDEVNRYLWEISHPPYNANFI